MVRPRFQFDFELPILHPTDRQRIVRRAQVIATKMARREIVKEARQRLARRTGTQRRRFGARTPRRRRIRDFYVALEIGYRWYTPQGPNRTVYFAIRATILEEKGPQIIRAALLQALAEEL